MIVDEIFVGVFNLQGCDVCQLLDEVEFKVFVIVEEGLCGQKGFLEIQLLLMQVVECIDELYYCDNQSDIMGVLIGFVDFDCMMSGMQGGDLIIVVGCLLMGKMVFLLNIGEYVVVEQGLLVVVFLMEMVGMQFVMCMLGLVG